jgi:hypothetical protein
MIAALLMGGGMSGMFYISSIVSGAIAGIGASKFAIWSRVRLEGRENIFYGIANYYIGIIVFWLCFIIIERVKMCIQSGGWTDFDLADQFGLILVFIYYGTLWYGLVLIPLCFVSRHIIWRAYVHRVNQV